MFYFSELLDRSGVGTAGMRLLRHDQRGSAAWMRSQNSLGCFASFQRKRRRPYNGATIACQFVAGPTLPDGDVTALFVGATRILDCWDWDNTRLPAIQDDVALAYERAKMEKPDREPVEAFDLQWVDELQPYVGKVLVRWGAQSAARAWSQWANMPKEILELRMSVQEPPFPGLSVFQAKISEILWLPQAWQAALGSVRGVYLLVAESGEQYVGSAGGADGFLGRWHSYAANGHGGNIRLRERGLRDYQVSILEVASPDMSWEDIVNRETFWKRKLGSRAHGLNGN